MTTYDIYFAHPSADDTKAGFDTPTPSGLSLDDSVTGSGVTKAALDEYVGSTTALKIGKLLAEFQRADLYGRKWMATSDAGTTYIKPTL